MRLNSKRDLITEQYKKLHETFSGLELKETIDGRFTITGKLGFTKRHDGKTIQDDYDIEIAIPDDYPQNPPTVKEIGNKIPRDKDNHVNSTDGTLCLGAPLAVKETFAQRRNLLWFVKEQVVRFLFNNSYKRDYGVRPDGELPHYGKGLLEYYYEFFGTTDNITVLEFLRILANNHYDDHSICPCGSGNKIRKCHYRILKKARRLQSAKKFQYELAQIMIDLNVH
jgi:hypothetical protein